MPTAARCTLAFVAFVMLSLAGCRTQVTEVEKAVSRPVVTPQEGSKLSEHLRIAWRVRVPVGGLRKLYVDRGIVYVESTYNQLVALDETDGHLLWVVQTRQPLDHAPCSHLDRLYFFSGEHMYVVDRATGELLRQKDPHLGVTTVPVASPGGVLVCSADGRAHAVNPQDVWPTWSRSLESVVLSAAGTPERLYVLTLDSRVSALDAGTGHIVWSRDLEAEAPAVAPAASQRSVYVAGADLQLYAFDPAGSQLWRKPLGGQALNPPAVAGGHVIVTVEPGAAVVLDADTGEVRWKRKGPHRFLTASSERAYFLDREAQRLLGFSLEDGGAQGALEARSFFDFCAEPDGGRFVAATREGDVYSIVDASAMAD